MARWRRLTSAAGLAAGVTAAGAGALLAAEKIAAARLRRQPDAAAGQPFGELRGRPLTVLADDGIGLHTEINGPDDAPVTIVFCHGYGLNQDCWHYQRAALTSVGRLVFWDQRGHGRSGRPDLAHVSIDQTGADLYAVMSAAAPGPGPVVLVGHSMGGMTVMALADQHPELFGTKVIAAMLISTAASDVDPTSWLPAVARPAARQAVGPVIRGTAHGELTGLVDWSRQAAGDFAFLLTRYMAFGDPWVSPTVVGFLEQIIRSTPTDVGAQFYLALLEHEKRAALRVLGQVPTTIIAAERDRLVPLRSSLRLAAEVPGAELIRVPGAGHVVILERPQLVNDAITQLVLSGLARAQADGRPA
jgi:pimeloyl-ACP methyl ester carboxylesterase